MDIHREITNEVLYHAIQKNPTPELIAEHRRRMCIVLRKCTDMPPVVQEYLKRYEKEEPEAPQ